MQDKKLADNKLIGKFAALAVSDTVYITSNYNKVQTKYLMYRDGHAIKIDELSSSPTTEKNGLDILAYVKTGNGLTETLSQIRRTLPKIAYFKNLYLSCNIPNTRSDSYYFDRERTALISAVEKFNKRTFNDHGTYCTTSYIDEDYRNGIVALLGDVVYPIKQDITDWIKKTNGRYSTYCDLAIKFDIGSLDVTPNREELLYNVKTTAALKTNIDRAYDALCREAASKISIQEFVTNGCLNKTLYSTLFTGTTTYYFGQRNYVDLDVEDVRKYIQFFGKQYSDTIWNEVTRLGNDFILGDQIAKHSYNKTFKSASDCYLVSLGDYILYQKEGNMKSSYRAYLQDVHTYNSQIRVITFNNAVANSPYPDAKKIFQAIIDGLKKDIPVLSDETVPDEYKQAKKASTLTGNIRITTINGSWEDTRIGDAKWFFGDTTRLHVYCDASTFPIAKLLSAGGISHRCYDHQKYDSIRFFTTAKKNEDAVLALDNVISISELIKPDAEWAVQVKTAEELFKKYKEATIGCLNIRDVFKSLPGYGALVKKVDTVRNFVNGVTQSVIQLATNLGAVANASEVKKLELTNEEKAIVAINNLLGSEKVTFDILNAILSDSGMYAKEIDNLKQLLK